MSGVRVLMAKAGGPQVTLRRSVNEGQLDVARPFRSDNEHDALGGLVPERKWLSRVLARQPVDHIQVWISAPHPRLCRPKSNPLRGPSIRDRLAAIHRASGSRDARSWRHELAPWSLRRAGLRV